MSRIAESTSWLLLCLTLASCLVYCTGITCTFYYWRTSWHLAQRSCKNENKELLCYNSKKDIDDITAGFKLPIQTDAELEIWVSSRNCSSNVTEACLSLHLEKSNGQIWPYFQVSCGQRYPFICCSTETETEPPTKYTFSTSYPTSSSSKTVSSSAPTTTKEEHSCENIDRRGIHWPDTKSGREAVQPCPGRSIGEATWLCTGPDGQWDKKGPDLKQCRSLVVMDFKEKMNSSSASVAIDSLVDVFENREHEMFGEDLADIVALMSLLPHRLFEEIAAHPAETRWTSARGAVVQTTSVVDYMIEMNSTWSDIKGSRRTSVGSKLLETTESFALLLANAMDQISEESIIGKNIGLQVKRPVHGQPVKMSPWSMENSYQDKGTIVLHEDYDSELDITAGDVSVIFMLYKDLSNILTKQEEEQIREPGTLNSAVVSATVSQKGQSKSINGKVEILLENLRYQPNATACVFWNLHRHEWDASGCRLQGSNSTHSNCVCDHLTNFAVLMDYRGTLEHVDQVPFFFITVIGCSISIISLAICIVFFTCYSLQSRHAWGLRYSIHRNLCLCLLIANIVLVVGLDKTENRITCAVVAGLLHYSFLSAFSWMLLEGVHIYLLLVIVFASRKSHWEKYYAFGYGFPLLIVLITAIWRPSYYGTDTVCWLSVEKGTIWAFNGPVAAILLVNSAALFLAQWKASKMSSKEKNVVLLKKWLRVTFILFPILGITWLFGFLYVGKHFVINAYIFALLNSMQGFCIFIFHCLMDKKARSVFIASIRKKRASIYTGSSGTQRKPKEGKAEEKESDPSPSQGDASQKSFVNKTIYEPMRRAYKRDWTKWHKPWSFCFDVSVSDSSEVPKLSSETREVPKAVVLHWSNLQENDVA